MPTYEFLCADCGAATQVRAAIRDRDTHLLDLRCDDCGGAALRRLFNSVTVLGSRPAAGEAGGCGCGGGCACRG